MSNKSASSDWMNVTFKGGHVDLMGDKTVSQSMKIQNSTMELSRQTSLPPTSALMKVPGSGWPKRFSSSVQVRNFDAAKLSAYQVNSFLSNAPAGSWAVSLRSALKPEAAQRVDSFCKGKDDFGFDPIFATKQQAESAVAELRRAVGAAPVR